VVEGEHVVTAVQAASAARTRVAEAGQVLREVGRLVWWLLRWIGRHWRYTVVWLLVGVIADAAETPGVKAAAVLSDLDARSWGCGVV
jgi:hypothetical protein